MKNYTDYLATKRLTVAESGFECEAINPQLFPFQRDIVKWALKKGKACIFADCGLGKTPMQLEWARQVCNHTGGNVLILAPLAVSHQTQREGDKFGVKVNICRSESDIVSGVNIANYKILHKFEGVKFAGIVLDESSILKSYTGHYRTQIIEYFISTPYKLACTATPAPNDYMELGNHAEFMGVMSRTEMLSMFFVHDGGETSKWRLKGHARNEFWKWMAEWSVVMSKPSDLGYEDNGFILPGVSVVTHYVDSDSQDGFLFAMPCSDLQSRRRARKSSLELRVDKAKELVTETDKWLIWCNYNDESDSLSKSINGAVEVEGADSDDHKEKSMIGFAGDFVRVLVTKPKIAGFGMNWQSCSNMIFCGLSDSYEQYYQAYRRCYRFGQTKHVTIHIIISEAEQPVLDNIKRKECEARKMFEEMVEHTKALTTEHVHGTKRKEVIYSVDRTECDEFTMINGDCVEETAKLADDSIHYTIFSPPFASLYTYSNSDRDMGNCKSDVDFYQHFEFLVEQLYRVTMPGRLLSFHCMNLPVSKQSFGYIGIRDFRGELIRLFEKYGWIFHSEVCIWKDPVTAMQRTKAIGLLHKQLVKDSAMSRQGIPDYLVTMRKPGDNQEPIAGALDTYAGEPFKSEKNLSIDIWQRYASPVWMDIRPGNTLQKESARENDDERHICPLQLDVIERGIQLWSNPGDVVLSPFGGIGSDGYQAIVMGRRYIGIELKASYYKCAVNNLNSAVSKVNETALFA